MVHGGLNMQKPTDIYNFLQQKNKGTFIECPYPERFPDLTIKKDMYRLWISDEGLILCTKYFDKYIQGFRPYWGQPMGAHIKPIQKIFPAYRCGFCKWEDINPYVNRKLGRLLTHRLIIMGTTHKDMKNAVYMAEKWLHRNVYAFNNARKLTSTKGLFSILDINTWNKFRCRWYIHKKQLFILLKRGGRYGYYQFMSIDDMKYLPSRLTFDINAKELSEMEEPTPLGDKDKKKLEDILKDQ